MTHPPAGRAKYAVAERERRWIVDPPVAADVVRRTEPAAGVRIADRYLTGTRLRLRTTTSHDGAVAVKLGHKVVVDPVPPMRVAHTSLYLDDAEAALLRSLPAAELVKTRHQLDGGGRAFALDVFGGDLEGLVLCEVDLGESDDLDAVPPFPVLDEVTGDLRLTGGELATTGRAAARALLAELGVRPR